jgi:hypothetical protein
MYPLFCRFRQHFRSVLAACARPVKAARWKNDLHHSLILNKSRHLYSLWLSEVVRTHSKSICLNLTSTIPDRVWSLNSKTHFGILHKSSQQLTTPFFSKIIRSFKDSCGDQTLKPDIKKHKGLITHPALSLFSLSLFLSLLLSLFFSLSISLSLWLTVIFLVFC